MCLKQISFLLFLFPFLSFSQNSALKVTVTDNQTNEPIVGASVSILMPSSKAYLRGGQTFSDGAVLIENINAGRYILRISYVGYADIERENIILEAQKILNLGVVKMMPEEKRLGEVVIEGKVPVLQLGIDKKVFDVAQSMVSVGGTAQDVLGNVPTLQVDVDGSVSLRGSSNIRILIDGKETAMAVSDVSKLLQSLPAEAISKVELMTNPSAKYDAEGQAGLVNIILKKNVRTGLNGTINASVGNYDNFMVGTSLNYRDHKFNYFGNYSFHHRNNVGENTVRRASLIDGVERANSEVTTTNAKTFRKGKNHSFRLGADYYASEKTTLSLGTNFSVRDNDRGEDILYRYFNQPDLGTESPRKARQSEQDLGYDIILDFKRELKRKGEELVANATYGNDQEDGTNSYRQTFYALSEMRRQNITHEAGQNWNVQLDYILPLGDNHKFEAGIRSVLRNSAESQYSDTLALDGLFKPDYGVSNDFEMNNNVHALYVNYQRMLSDRIGVQVGLRGENARLETTTISMDPDLRAKDRIVPGGYDFFRIYPSAFLTYDVSKGGDKVQLSYTRRVQRPRGWQVNPFVNLSDETNIRQGNSNLKPEDIHALEMSFAKFFSKWNFVSSLYYRHVNDMTQPLMYEKETVTDPAIWNYLDQNSNATFSRWQNVGSRNNAGVELIAKVNLYNLWDVMANVNVFYSNVVPYADFDISRPKNLGWNTNWTANMKITPTLSTQVKADYRAPMKTLQGRMKAMSGVDFALKQDVLKGKGNVVFNISDVFNNGYFGMESFLPSSSIDQQMRWSKRRINLSMSYRFGKQDMTKGKKRNADMQGDEGGAEF